MSPTASRSMCALRDRLADCLDRLDLGVGQAEPPELVGARERAPRRGETDRRPRTAGPGSRRRWRSTVAGRRRWRTARQSRPRGGAARTRRPSRSTGARRGSAATSCGEAGLEIGFGVEEVGHAIGGVSVDQHVIATPAVMHDKRTIMTPPVFRFAPSPERLSASRPCAVGAAECRHGARGGRTAAAAHRGHRRDALPAGIRGGDLRGPRLARHRHGNSRCGGSPSISTTIAPRWRSSRRMGLIYPSFESRAEIARLVAERERASAGRAIRTARRFIPATRKRLPRAERAGADRRRRALCAAPRHGGGGRTRRRR